MEKTNEKGILEIGFEDNFTDIPTDFKYTCVCWLGNPIGYFSNKKFNFKTIFAIGTYEGPILLIGFDGSKLHRISLLCGHTSKVTSITLGFPSDTFFSISRDGEMIIWSCLDGSCLMKFPQSNALCGDYHIAVSPVDANIFYAWRFGGRVHSYHFKNQALDYEIPRDGVISCCPCVDGSLILVTYDEIIQYSHNIQYSKSKSVSLTLHIQRSQNSIFISTQFGLIHLNKEKVVIYQTKDLQILFQSKFKNITKDDYLIYASWPDNKIVSLLSLNGVFIKIKNITQDPCVEISQISMKLPITNSIFSPKNELINVIGEKQIMLFNDETKEIFYLEERKRSKIKPNNNENYDQVNLSKEQILFVNENNKILTTNRHNMLYSHCLDGSCISYEHPSNIKITAAFIVMLRNHEFIISGDNHGNISIFNNQNKKASFPLLTSSVISFCLTPFFNGGTPCIIAIGKDSSLGLFSLNDMRMSFLTTHLPIVAIYCIENFSLLFVEYDDGMFLSYHINDPTPISQHTTLNSFSKKATLIWRRTSYLHNEHVYSTFLYKIADKSISFSMINLNKFTDKDIRKEEDPNYKNILISQAKNFVSTMKTKAISLDNSSTNFQDFKDKQNTNPKSFVILGTSLTPTFFYEPYKLIGKLVFDTSPSISAIHWIAYQSFNSVLNDDEKEFSDDGMINSECIPFLTQLLFHTNERISKICTMYITSQLTALDSAIAQSMISFIVKSESISELLGYEKILLGIVAVRNSHLIPKKLLSKLFKELIAFANSTSHVRHIALIILVSGVETWLNESSHSDLFIYLIKQMFRETTSLYLSLLSKSAKYDFSVFLDSIESIITESLKKPDEIERLLNLLSNACFETPKGYLGTILLVKLLRLYPQLENYIMRALSMHCLMFPAIDLVDKTILIGLPNGAIRIFQENFKDYEIQIFKSLSVDNVVLNEENIVCVNMETKQFAFLSLTRKKNKQIKRKPKITTTGICQGSGNKISIVNQSEIQIQLV